MKTLISCIFIIVAFMSCLAQKNNLKISEENYQLLTSFSAKYNLPTTHFYKNEFELNNMYSTLPKDYNRSLPLFVVDFDQKQVVLVPKKSINSYNIDSISGNDKIYTLHLSLIKGVDVKSDSSNLLMMIVPKSVKKISIKTK